MNKLSLFKIASILLLGTTLFLGNWGFQMSENNKVITEENQTLSKEVEELNDLKETLKAEVDSLMVSYEKVTEEKTVLQELLGNTKTKLAKTTSAFQQFKETTGNTILTLKEQIQQLFRTRVSLEETIKETNIANNVLLEDAGIDRSTFEGIMSGSEDKEVAFKQLLAEYKVAQKRKNELEIANRVSQIKANLKPKEIYLEALRATAFRVELEMKNGKATSKAKRVKMIKLSFELNDVPEKYLGTQELFLVIKDEQRKLLTKKDATVTINTSGNAEIIKTTSSRTLELDNNQRVRFNYDVDEKLDPGFYSITIYAKDGLLGKTSFKVI